MKEESRFLPACLQCEYAENPIGIDQATPLFSWQMQSSERGQVQAAYRIQVAGSQELLVTGDVDLWDSGKVDSSQSCGIAYEGKTLRSGQTCFWKVTLWDGMGTESRDSEINTFEMGLLEPEDWMGWWMGFTGGMNGSSLLLRKEFNLSKDILKARAYVSGLGYYELRLNGNKVGDHVLDPGLTDYSKRVLYSSYDVTDLLRAGKNVVGMMLGNGWYGIPKARLQMNIDFADGYRMAVCTRWDWGEGWYVAKGPILRNSIYDGELYDARLEKAGWDTPDYDLEKENHKANGWITATSVEDPGGRMVSQLVEPIKIVGEIGPLSARQLGNGVWIYDTGQNMAGWAAIEVRGRSGTVVTMKYAESLYENGAVNQANLRLAEAKDTYILSGKGMERYSPRFTYHGFRYIQVEIEAGEAEILSLTAQVVRSSVEPTGSFECSNALINQIHHNVCWTEASNLHSIPTDCPQRDERMAWLNDATARAEEAVYNFNMSRFYQKWLEDISDTQDETSGAIADTAPYRWGFRVGDPVISCYLMIPLLLYRHYGNKRVLEQHYKGLKQWVGYLESEAEDGIVKRSYYGDWASPVIECEQQSEGDGAVSKSTPGELVSTAYFYLDAALIAQIAHILGRADDEEYYNKLADRIKEAFNKKFLDEGSKNYSGGSQGANSIALKFGLAPELYTGEIVNNLVADIEQRHQYHLSTGNQCTKHMLEVLAEYGKVETAYRVVTQETYPGWGFMISHGATTIWERWEYDISDTMNSRNHPMHANVGSWLYKILAGINPDAVACGFDKIIIKPYPAGDLNYVDASLKTVKGLVQVKWTRGQGDFSLQVTIPGNCSAKVCIPVSLEDSSEMNIWESGTCIWKDGGFFGGVDGITGAVLQKDSIEFSIGSGNYCFQLITKTGG